MFNLAVPWWELVLRGVVVYALLIILLRMTGKRQIGQLSPFDLVLLLILSNSVQNSMNAGDNSLIGGLISAVTLVVLNYLVGLVTFKSRKLEEIVEGRPQVLIHEGKLFAIEEVKLAILENNGGISAQGYSEKQSADSQLKKASLKRPFN